jgi:putative protease
MESTNHPEQGDGIVFTTKTGEKVFGMSLDTAPILEHDHVLIKSARKVQPGYEVFMTRRASLQRWASSLIKSAEKPKISLDLELKWDEELIPIIEGQITAADGEIIPITYRAEFAMEPAQKRPLGGEQIREQLQKTGGTIFTIRTLKINYPGGLFCPISILNRLRRDFLEEVEGVLIARDQPDRRELKPLQNRLERIKKDLTLDSQAPAPTSNPDLAVWISDLESLHKAVEGNCKRAYLESQAINLGSNKGARKLLKLMQRAIKMVDDSDTELIWKWPSITPHSLLRNLDPILTELVDWGLSGVMVDGLGASEVVKTHGGSLKLYGSTGLNIWNHRTIQELAGSFQCLTISPELSRDDLKKLTRLKRTHKLATDLEIMVQGNQEVLISQDTLGPAMKRANYVDNVFWGVKDNKNHVFPVRWYQDGRTQLFNSVELCLIDQLPNILKMGWAGLVIDARGKPTDYTKDMIELYQEALQLSLQKPSDLLNNLKILKEEVKIRSTGGITSGNFLRGLVN